MVNNRRPVLVLRARQLTNRARESLFFVPAVMVVAGALVSIGVASLNHGISPDALPSALRISTNAAQTLLSTIAGATITTVGVVFSINVVSVQLASGQFSPRVIRGFFRDRHSQIVVGILAATFAYCVIALYAVSNASYGGEQQQTQPVVAVGIAVLLGLASIMSIVSYLDHSARRLYVGNIARGITEESLQIVARFGREAEELAANDDTEADDDPPGDFHLVRARHDGWVQQVSTDAMLRSVPDGTTVRLETRVGAYVVEGVPLASLWPVPEDVPAAEEAVNNGIALGDGRTMQQDLDFGLRQLSDIALRAVSPALNDPTTAVEVVLQHGAILRRLLQSGLPPRVRKHDSGTRLLRPYDLSYGDYIDHAFEEIRRGAYEHPTVAAAMIRTCQALMVAADEVGCPERAQSADRQIQMIIVGCERAGLLDEEMRVLRGLAGG